MSDGDCLLCAAEVPHDLWGRRRDYPAPHPYTQAMQDEFDAGKQFEKDTVRRLLTQAPDSDALRERGIAPARVLTDEQIQEAANAGSFPGEAVNEGFVIGAKWVRDGCPER